MEEKDIITQKEELEIIKLQNEIVKIKSETTDLNKHWLKKPQWYPPLLSLLTIIGTLFIAWKTGFLDNQELLNKIEEKNLIIDIKEFKSTKESLFKTNDSLFHLNDSFLRIIETSKQQISSLNTAFEIAKKDKRGISEQVATLILEKQNLKKYNDSMFAKTKHEYEDKLWQKAWEHSPVVEHYRDEAFDLRSKVENCETEKRILQKEIDGLRIKLKSN